MLNRTIHEQNAQDIEDAIAYQWEAKRKAAAGDKEGAARAHRMERMVRRMMKARIRTQRTLTRR